MLPTKLGFKFNPFFCALLPLTMHGMAFAQALPTPTDLPTGGQVVSGSAVITTGRDFNDTDFVHVAQGSNNVLINWSTFDIANGNLVQFDQPDAGSVAVNRVLSPNASFLNGALNSNGRVFVINPNGVLFGQGSEVNVGGLLATTFDISEGDFNAGRFVFNQGAAGQGEYAGVVLNQGNITVGADGREACCVVIGNETGTGGSLTDGSGNFVTADVGPTTPGVAVLAGRRVENEGNINAFGGQIGLASGSSIAVSFDNGLISYEVTPSTLEAVNDLAAIRNSGVLTASGGSVTLLARASNSTPGVGILNIGVIRATGISIDGSGGVYLTSTGGSIESTGTIDASASECCFYEEESGPSVYTPQAVRIESDRSVVIRAPVPSSEESFTGPTVVSAVGPLLNADAGGVPSAGTIHIQGASVTLSDASITGSSQVRIVATSGDVTGGSGTSVSGSAVGISAAGDAVLRGSYESFTNFEVPVVAGLEGALDPGSISIQGADVALNGARVDAATQARIVATTGGITSSPSSNVSGRSLDIAAPGNVELAGLFSTGKIIRSPELLLAPSKEGVSDPDGISIQGVNVDLNGVDISAAGPVRITATAGDVNALSSGNEVSGSALDIRASGSVKLSGSYRAGPPSVIPEIVVAANDDGVPPAGTVLVQGADVVLDGVSIEADNQVRIRATSGGILGVPNDGFNDVYGSALDFQAAGGIQLSGAYLAGFDPGASLAFVDEASETGDVFIQGSEVVFNGASVTGSGEMRIIATSGDVSDIQVGGTSSTSNQITANALGIQAARSILLSGSSLTVGTGETSIGGDPTIGDVLGVVERLQALYPPSPENASVTARADGVEIYDTSDNPSTPISPPIFVPNHQLPNASFVSGEGGVIRIGSLQMSGDYLFLQSDNPALQFSPTPFQLFIQLVAAGLGGSIAFEQNPGSMADLNLSPSFFSGIDDVNATLVFGSLSNPGNVFVGQEGVIEDGTSGFNYVLAAGEGGLIFNPEHLLTPGEVVILGQVASGGPLPPVDPPPGNGVLFPSPLPPGQTAEVIAARSEPVTRSAADLTFDVAAALDSSIQYNSAAGPILACQ
jgi:filamentous hemagglutinin family protein